MSQENQELSPGAIAGITAGVAVPFIVCCWLCVRKCFTASPAKNRSVSPLAAGDPALSISIFRVTETPQMSDTSAVSRDESDTDIEINTPRLSERGANPGAVNSIRGSMELQSLERKSDPGPLTSLGNQSIKTDAPTPVGNPSDSPSPPETKRRHSITMGESKMGFFSGNPKIFQPSPRQRQFEGNKKAEREEALKKVSIQVVTQTNSPKTTVPEAKGLAEHERIRALKNRIKAVSFEDGIKDFSDEVREARKRFGALNVKPLNSLAEALGLEIQKIEWLESVARELERRVGKRRKKPEELKSTATHGLALRLEKLTRLGSRVGELEKIVKKLEKYRAKQYKEEHRVGHIAPQTKQFTTMPATVDLAAQNSSKEIWLQESPAFGGILLLGDDLDDDTDEPGHVAGKTY